MQTTRRKEVISARVVERLSRYGGFLRIARQEGTEHIFSRQIATACGTSAVQVRRDLMAAGCGGGSNQGYQVSSVLEGFGAFFRRRGEVNAGIVGVGRLGSAIIDHLEQRRPWVRLVAAFEIDPPTGEYLIGAVRRYPMSSLETVIEAKQITIGLLAVPARACQTVANRLVAAGVRGFVNFVPAFLHVPSHVLVENMDTTSALEKVGYFVGVQKDEEMP